MSVSREVARLYASEEFSCFLATQVNSTDNVLVPIVVHLNRHLDPSFIFQLFM